MGIFKGLVKVALSPLKGIAEIPKDLTDDDSVNGALSAGTFGASSIIKGTAKGIMEGVDEIFD